MNSQQWIEKSGDRYIMKTYGRYPIRVHGQGAGDATLDDADGREYLDFLGGVAVNNLGHCTSCGRRGPSKNKPLS